MEKICSKCGELKDVVEFGKVKANKDGYNGQCKICVAEYQKEHYENNKDEQSEKAKEYYQNNKEEILEKAKEYYGNNKEERRTYKKEYYGNNKEKMNKKSKEYSKNNRDKINKTRRTYISSENAKIANLSRCRILLAVKAGGAKKCASTKKLLGCTIIFYREYIESKFTKGMTWENQGNVGWHFDHIRPCNSFHLQDPAQQYACFNYTNIQPLWATTAIAMSYGEGPEYVGNLEKGGKF